MGRFIARNPHDADFWHRPISLPLACLISGFVAGLFVGILVALLRHVWF